MAPQTNPKFVLITGCSHGGIGHALAREFQSRGFQVIATARSRSKMSDLEAFGINLLTCDVTSSSSVAQLKTEVHRITDGKLHYLINNAGRNYTVPATDIDMAEVEETFQANVFGVMRMCQVFAPLLIEAKGTIVQIGSVAAIMPYVFGSVYNSSKAALHQYSNTLRLELKAFDVNVITVVTGGVKSNIANTPRDLPEDSIYVPLAQEYQRRLKHSQEVGIANEAYAKYVVPRLIGGTKKRTVWAGYGAWLIWFSSTFLPWSVFDFAFARMFNLWKLKPANAKKLT